MEDFQIYILQVNAGLVVFYLLYRMLFSRDTFLRIRRLFLFSIVILAFVYPLISLASWLEQGNALPGMVVGYAEMLAVVTPVAPQPAAEQSLFTWQRFLIWIWSGGSLVLTLRMAVQLAGICRFAIRVKNRAVIMFRSLLCRRLQLLSLSSVGFLSIRPITKSGNFMRLSYTSLLMSANGIHWICYSGRYFVSFSGSIRLSGFYVKKSGRIWNF